ncbi:unnamed protein product [Nezara viridula]|uniref:Neuropeptide n=1 Tax=Nezara viridula TaxID=85310 RepID=A0A9P0HLB7_NEZVI|nr:unnamed protein product [Nezara viridula]
MILCFIVMMNVLPGVAINSYLMDPMRMMITHRAVQKFLEFKHNVEHLWSRTTTPKFAAQIYRLSQLRNSPLKVYRPEPLRRIPNFTEEVYPKRLILVTTPKKMIFNAENIFRVPKMDNKPNLPRYPFGRRYTFFPLNTNNFDKSKLFLHINQYPQIIPNLPSIDIYNEFPTIRNQYRPRVISSAEIDPQLKVNGTITLEIPTERKKRENGLFTLKIPYLIQNVLSCRSSYPRCLSDKKFWPLLGRYEPSDKKKLEKRSHEISSCDVQEPKLKREIWPLLGGYNQVPLSQQKQIENGLADHLSPVLASKRSNEMHLISKLSEMKAKEHIAEDNRLAEMHKTQEAKRDFQERIAEQLDLLSEAKRADLRAKRAFEKVVKLERGLSEQDRQLHRLKEFEDQLYEELLESEAEVALADMQIIPKFINEEDLQEFMAGPRFGLDSPRKK